MTVQNIRETILVENWYRDDWETNSMEGLIMAGLSLKPSMLNKNSWKQKLPSNNSPNIFMLPQKNFIKLNFDETEKGNPGALVLEVYSNIPKEMTSICMPWIVV